MQFAAAQRFLQTKDVPSVLATGAFVLLALIGASATANSFSGLTVSNGAGTTRVPAIPNAGNPASVALSEAIVSIHFNEGFESAYLRALPILDAAKLHATLNVKSRYVGYYGYVNEAQLTYVEKRGHQVLRDAEVGGTVLTITSDTDLDDITTAIDEAVSNKQHLVITFHRIDEPRTRDGKNASSDLVRKTVDYLLKKKVRVMTDAEATRFIAEGA